MERGNQVVEAKSETETKVEYRYTLDHLSSRVFVSLLINFRDLVKQEGGVMAREKAQVKLGEVTSLVMLGEEDEEETVHQEVLLDEEQEVPLDGLVPLQLWIGRCCHCFQSH